MKDLLNNLENLPVRVVKYAQVEVEEMTEAGEWLRLATAAERRGLKPHTLRNWMLNGHVPALVLDGVHFIRMHDLDEYISRQRPRATRQSSEQLD